MKIYSEDIHRFIYKVGERYNNYSIKDFLKANDFSTALIRKIKNQGNVFVNNQETKLYEKVFFNDLLLINIGKEKLDVEPENIPLQIIYEDKDLLVINKDPFMVTHPLKRYPKGTLANAISYYFSKNGIDTKFRFINRLDKNTSGIILVSKNLYGHNFVQKQIKEGKVKKVYCAVVQGKFKKKEGKIEAPIARENNISIIRKVNENGQNALTFYKVLEEYKDASLVELRPKTGRTHQLRVHMQYVGHPIIGDDLYNPFKSLYLNRQALHAKSIEFILPRKKEKIILEAELSEDIKELIKFLKR